MVPRCHLKRTPFKERTSVYCKRWLGGPALSVRRDNEDERAIDADVMVGCNFSLSGDDVDVVLRRAG